MAYKKNYNSLLPDDFVLSEEFESIVEQLESEQEAEIQLREEQKALIKVEGKLLIRAPVDAIVLEVPTQSEGSIVKEGQVVVKLVPRDVPLVLEVDVDCSSTVECDDSVDVLWKSGGVCSGCGHCVCHCHLNGWLARRS